jgi:ubiquitin carboxyl-terminal hydrolase 22/27/51
MYEYDLFAVINHEGQMDNGHYTNFARFQDEVSKRSEVLLHAC